MGLEKEEEIVVENFQEINVCDHATINQKQEKFRRNDSLEIESQTTSNFHHSKVCMFMFSSIFHGIIFNENDFAGSINGDNTATGVSKSGNCLRRYRNFAVVCVFKCLPRRDKT